MTIKQFAFEIGVEAEEVKHELLDMGVFVYITEQVPVGYQLSIAKKIIQKRDLALTESQKRATVARTPWTDFHQDA